DPVLRRSPISSGRSRLNRELSKGGTRNMAQLEKAQENQLKELMSEFKRLQKKLHRFISKPAMKTSVMGCSRSKLPNTQWKKLSNIQVLAERSRTSRIPAAHRRAKQWHKIVTGLKNEGSKFLKTHPSEDLETALKALEIAAASLEEVAERYE